MIQPGLERIGQLLHNVQFPWRSIHVAGTNGKGSICGFAAALLTRRNIRNGRFTSPHLIDRWDCIQVNGKPVSESKFRKVEKHFIELNQSKNIGASEFELLTATAFQIFNDEKVRVGVVEVGMGGKLDCTNILNNQAVSVISRIAFDHQSFLGNTLEDIARHKAGILRPNIPYIVNPVNEWNIHDVIDEYADEIGAGPRVLPDTPELREELYKKKDWMKLVGPLTPIQRDNIVLAYLAFLQVLKSLGESTKKAGELLAPLRTKQFHGRFHELSCFPVFGNKREFAVDGAHNPDAANALSQWVKRKYRSPGRKQHASTPENDGEGSGADKSPRQLRSITWVLAMTDGKDARRYLERILRPGDNVVTTSFGPVDGMPWVKAMDPEDLKKIADEVEPGITSVHVPLPGTFRALCTAKYLSARTDPIVLTGSLYLVGDFLRLNRQYKEDPSCLDITWIDNQERDRVNSILSWKSDSIDEQKNSNLLSVEAEKRKLEEEIEVLDREMQALEMEETRLRRTRSTSFDRPVSHAMSHLSLNNRSQSNSVAGTTAAQKNFEDESESERTQLEELTPTVHIGDAKPANDLRTLMYNRARRRRLNSEAIRSAQLSPVRYFVDDTKRQVTEDNERPAQHDSPEAGPRLKRSASPSSPPQRQPERYPREDTRFQSGKVKMVKTRDLKIVSTVRPLKGEEKQSTGGERKEKRVYIRKFTSRVSSHNPSSFLK